MDVPAQRERWRRVTLVAIVALAAVAWAPPAHASHDPSCPAAEPEKPAGPAFVWREAQCLSAEQQSGEAPQVAIADDGSAIAVWRFNDPVSNKSRVQFTTRAPGETFFEPLPTPADPDNPTPAEVAAIEETYLSNDDMDVGTQIRLEMNKAGDAVVVWEADDGPSGANPQRSIRSAYKPAGGEFGDEELVQFDTNAEYVDPEVGIDGDGDATVIYHRRPAPFQGIVTHRVGYTSETRPAAGTWGDPKALTVHDDGTDANPVYWSEDHGELDVSENGNRYAVITSEEDGTPSDRQVVYELFRGASDANWVVDETHDQDEMGGSPNVEIRDTRQVVRGDTKLTTFSKSFSLFASYNLSPLAALEVGNGPTVGGSDVAVESDEGALVMWEQGAADDTDRGLVAMHRPAGNDSYERASQPVPGNQARERPDLAADGNDKALTVFRQQVGDDYTVQAALRPPGQTTGFDNPIALSTPGELEEDQSNKPNTGPQVAMNDDGEAVAVWSRKDSGGQLVVQAAVYAAPAGPASGPPGRSAGRPPRFAASTSAAQASRSQPHRPGAASRTWRCDGPSGQGAGQCGEASVELRQQGRAARRGRRGERAAPDRRAPEAGRHRLQGDRAHRGHGRLGAHHFPDLQHAQTAERRGQPRGHSEPEEGGDAAGLRGGRRRDAHHPEQDVLSDEVVSGQQKISGCFKPIEGLRDIPGSRGAPSPRWEASWASTRPRPS